jgi:DMSO/TMAO reductase YedYZ molybdopterin-dependent catalytic subunit
LECSGNTGLPFFTGGIGNARWAGTPLAPILQSAGIAEEGTEVVFWGSDSGPVTISDNEAFTEPFKTTEKFARSMSVAEAMDPRNLLCYQMNGVDLPPEHGAPVRLIAPGWYGVANVKWLERIEVRDGRFAGRFMARDYVTVRREGRENGQNVYTFTNVSHDRLKSAPARVTRIDATYFITGAAWGAPIAGVDVSIDHGPWMPARLVDQLPARGRSPRRSEFAWSFWTFACVRRRRQRAARSRRPRAHRPEGAPDDRRPRPCVEAHVLGEQRTDHTSGAHSLTSRRRPHRTVCATAQHTFSVSPEQRSRSERRPSQSRT